MLWSARVICAGIRHSIECVEIIQDYSNALTKCKKKCNGVVGIGESYGLLKHQILSLFS
jgi:hypothetical protein